MGIIDVAVAGDVIFLYDSTKGEQVDGEKDGTQEPCGTPQERLTGRNP